MQPQLSEERQAQLNAYAARHGQDPSAALDDMLAEALEWDRKDSLEAVEAIQQSYDSVKTGNTRPASEFLNGLREKHGFRG